MDVQDLKDLIYSEFKRVDEIIKQEILRNDERHKTAMKEVLERRTDLRTEILELIKDKSDYFEAAITAVKDSLSQSVNANKEAVIKAETASEKRSDSVNEFRNTLKDQQSSLLPRGEAQTIFQSFNKQIDAIIKDVSDLRDSRNVISGQSQANDGNQQRQEWTVGVVLALGLGLLGFVISILDLVLKVKP